MDFKRPPEGRFKSLAGERKNPFSSNQNQRNTTPTSSSSGSNRNKSKYVPPSKRNKNIQREPKEGMRLPDVEDRRKAPTPPPDTQNIELFPSLSTLKQESEPNEDSESKEVKASFATIATEKQENEVETKEKEPLKPGWVRLFRGNNGEIIHEHGPPVPESDFFRRMREHEERKAREQLLETLERNIAYSREMDPYYDDYCDQYGDDDDEDEEYVSDHEYVEEYDSEGYDEDY